MKKNIQKTVIYFAIPVFLLIAVSCAFFLYHKKAVKNSLPLTFSQEGTVAETGKMPESKSLGWWLNSGGVMEMKNGFAKTNFGPLPEGSQWQKLYAKNNSRDTDDGYYPQNIFRLVTRGNWQDLAQEVYFNIDKINLSASDYRDESNGVLLFNRYQDGDNLYYTGLRVDGHAVIKKKINGKYYTLKEKKIFTNNGKYDRDKNPGLIPLHTWLGIKSEVRNVDSDTVDIKLFIDWEQKRDWQLVLETQDKSSDYGKAPFLKAGHAGIRTDFMDVAFQNYKIQ